MESTRVMWMDFIAALMLLLSKLRGWNGSQNTSILLHGFLFHWITQAHTGSQFCGSIFRVSFQNSLAEQTCSGDCRLLPSVQHVSLKQAHWETSPSAGIQLIRLHMLLNGLPGRFISFGRWISYLSVAPDELVRQPVHQIWPPPLSPPYYAFLKSVHS